ncbi:hypothetical protein [Marinicella meishanensis]|nr:hypothetical protein [Marinicella sp. NBU2979]
MTLCPYALVAGCEKCPILKVCPLKTVIGNQAKPKDPENSPKQTPADE